MKIVLTGGTGFVGKALLPKLIDAGHEVSLLSRSERRTNSSSHPALRTFAWDAKTQGVWSKEIDGADAVINLAGESIAAKRWTATQKELLLNSRIDSTRALVEAIARSQKKPAVLINASAVGFYGNVDEGDVTELHPNGKDFLAHVCARWEEEARKAENLNVRTVLLRFGVILEKGSGALEKFIPPFQFFIGGPLGSGRQWFPWVHREDTAEVILFSLQNQALAGAVNVTAPEVVTMKEFCRHLGRAMRRPSWALVPGFALRLLLGEMAGMILGGQRAVPKKLLEAGYTFRHPGVQEALDSIFRK